MRGLIHKIFRVVKTWNKIKHYLVMQQEKEKRPIPLLIFVTQFDEPLVQDMNRQYASQIDSMTDSFYCKHILLSIHIN